MGEPVEAEKGGQKNVSLSFWENVPFAEIFPHIHAILKTDHHRDVTHDSKTSPHVFNRNIRSVPVKHLPKHGEDFTSKKLQTIAIQW